MGGMEGIEGMGGMEEIEGMGGMEEIEGMRGIRGMKFDFFYRAGTKHRSARSHRSD